MSCILQKINHFHGMLEICRKTPLARNMAAMAAAAPEHYDFCPRSYCLPEHRTQLLHDIAAGEAASAAAGIEVDSTLRIATYAFDAAHEEGMQASDPNTSENIRSHSIEGSGSETVGARKLAAHSHSRTYILKPSGGSQGKGIQLVQTAAQVHQVRPIS